MLSSLYRVDAYTAHTLENSLKMYIFTCLFATVRETVSRLFSEYLAATHTSLSTSSLLMIPVCPRYHLIIVLPPVVCVSHMRAGHCFTRALNLVKVGWLKPIIVNRSQAATSRLFRQI
jgi:hypothetical protein